MTLATASECEIITTCEAPSTTNVVRGRARSAMKLCNFGGMAVSRSPYTNQDGMVFQAGSVVQFVGRWILARLRDRRFFSLAALNEAIRGLLIDLNNRALRSWGRSRRELVDELDRPALTPLPDQPYGRYAERKRCRINLDYHVEIADITTVFPTSLVRQEVEARITQKTVEIFLRGKRVASHLRSTLPHRPTTVAEHHAKLASALS